MNMKIFKYFGFKRVSSLLSLLIKGVRGLFFSVLSFPFVSAFGFLLFTCNICLAELDGKKLFRQNCASCHKLDKDMTGPALSGVEERVPQPAREWIVKWVRNNVAVRKSGDEYANKIYEEWDGEAMNTFPIISDEEIFAILDYIKDPSLFEPVTAEVSPEEMVAEEEGISDDRLLIILGVIASILLLLVVVFSHVIVILTNVIKEKFPKIGATLPTVIPFEQRIKNILKSRTSVTIVILLALMYLSSVTWDAASNLGRQQGYQPEQPIKFSHKLHAGINKINCKYCHIGAEKGKHAVIPSVNICMNCHKAISEGPEFGTKEIAKIYDAFNNHKTVEWIKIHNLPDHVFFSHAQHVKVGGLECQTCHGPVEEMEEVYQFAPLSMGWCVNCHRETQVQFANNDYYDIFEKFHKDLKEGKINQITVQDIGGVECQKCHY